MLSFYRRLMALRQQEPALQIGDFVPVGLQGELMIYKRVYRDSEILINFSPRPQHYQPETKDNEIIFSFSAKEEKQIVGDSISIEGEQALVIKLGGGSKE